VSGSRSLINCGFAITAPPCVTVGCAVARSRGRSRRPRSGRAAVRSLVPRSRRTRPPTSRVASAAVSADVLGVLSLRAPLFDDSCSFYLLARSSARHFATCWTRTPKGTRRADCAPHGLQSARCVSSTLVELERGTTERPRQPARCDSRRIVLGPYRLAATVLPQPSSLLRPPECGHQAILPGLTKAQLPLEVADCDLLCRRRVGDVCLE